MRRLALLSWVALLASGCVYSAPEPTLPEFLPSYGVVDHEASEVELVDPDRDLDPDDAAAIRESIAEILVATKRREAGPPARFRAKVTLTPSPESSTVSGGGTGGGGEAILLGAAAVVVIGLAVPLGLAIDHEDLSVELTMEVDGKQYRGSGSAARGGSIYATGRERALSTALQMALMDAEERWLAEHDIWAERSHDDARRTAKADR